VIAAPFFFLLALLTAFHFYLIHIRETTYEFMTRDKKEKEDKG